MGQIDYVFRFADEDAAKAAARLVAHLVDAEWRRDHVIPNVTVRRISTGNPISGWFCLISTERRVALLEASSALQVACDRDEASAGRPFILVNNVGGILSDISVEPIFAGSNYPIGGFN